MSVKLFSSMHEGGNDKNTTRFFERESGKNHVWALALLPLSITKADEVMKQIQNTLVSRLLNDPQNEGGEENFEVALKDLNEIIPEIIGDKAEEVLRTGAILLAYMQDEELLVSSFGQGEVFLMRNGSLMEISEGLSPADANAEFFQNISSGDIQDGDKLLFSTYRVQRYITEKQLAGILQDGVTEAMEGITSAIDSEENGNMVLLSIKTPDMLPFEQTAKKGFSSGPIENAWEKISDSILNLFGKYKKRMPGVKRDQMLLGGAGIIAFILVILFFSLLSKDGVSEENMEYAEFVNGVEQKFSTVETRFLEKKNDEANLLLDQIEKQASEMLQKRVNVTKAEQILSIVQKKREYVNQIMRISNPEIMADLTAIKSDIQLQGFLPFKNEILAFDKDSLYRVLIAGANAEGLGVISNNDSITMGTPFESKDEAVFVTENGSVLEWKDGQTITADTADETWKNAVDIQTFSKFLYFLDPESQQIWKYERRDSGFTIPEEWVTVGQEFLKGAISFAIDGSVFVLNDSGDILKFHRGEKVAYEVRDVPGGVIAGDKIYTNDSLSSLFVLDKKDQKILILSKFENEAVYQKQIVLENTGDIIDFFATENKIYILTQERIFEIALAGTE